MIQTASFPGADSFVIPYKGWDVFRHMLKREGIDGLECLWIPGEKDKTLPDDMLIGCRLSIVDDWYDFMKKDTPELLRRYSTWHRVQMCYSGIHPFNLLVAYRQNLEEAIAGNVQYVVYEVANVTSEEFWTYEWQHDDYAILDATIEIINRLLRNVEPTFDFLLQNSWWPGFTFTDPKLTEYLLSHIDYPRVGIMLDTGHLMNTDTSIRSQEEGAEYILSQYRAHGELGKNVLGLNFNQSISGAYAKASCLPLDAIPKEFLVPDCEDGEIMQQIRLRYIDQKKAWSSPVAGLIIDEIEPKYLCHAFYYCDSMMPFFKQLKQQKTAIEEGYKLL